MYGFRLLLNCFGLFLLAQNATAQILHDPGTPQERAQRITQRMQEEIPLEPHQVDAIHQLNLRYAWRAQRELLDKGVSIWVLWVEGQRLQKAKERTFKSLLSEAQWASYLQLKKQTKSRLWKKLFGTAH